MSISADQLKAGIATTAFAFRGYNVKNLGRTGELLEHEKYGGVVETLLREASAVCSDSYGRHVDLVARVRERRETTLETYGEAIALIMATEMAQLRLMEDCCGVPYNQAKFAFGFSLGEITALVAGGVYDLDEAMRLTIAQAVECAELGAGVTLAVVFSRGEELPMDEIHRLCLRINCEGQGVIGISCYLSPNSLLLMGQGDTVQRFKQRMDDVLPDHLYLRINESHWPPLHTHIVNERYISDRACLLLNTLTGGFRAPQPPIVSMVTGELSYTDYNSRELICRWTDHPQRVWDVIYKTLSSGIETVVHVGPAPNIIPATFRRLSENVQAQTKASLGMRALSAVANRTWLKNLLPARTALLRAPLIRHVILEDWLLEQES